MGCKVKSTKQTMKPIKLKHTKVITTELTPEDVVPRKIEYPEVTVHKVQIDSIVTEVKACKLILSNLNKEFKYPKPAHIKDLRDEFSVILDQLKELRKGIK